MRKRKGEAGVEMPQKKSNAVMGDPRETQGVGGRMAYRLKNKERISLFRKNGELQSGKGTSLE